MWKTLGFSMVVIALAVTSSYAANLSGGIIISQLVPTDGTTRSYYWPNNGSSIMYIKKVEIWLGRDKDMITDFWAVVVINSSGALLAHYSQDFYANPDGPTQITQSFAPDSFPLLPGDSLRLDTAVIPFGNPYWQPLGAQVIVAIWYTGS